MARVYGAGTGIATEFTTAADTLDPTDTAPQHVEYALTDLGKTLQEPLAAICAWALEHADSH
jgi:hypothetical protein